MISKLACRSVLPAAGTRPLMTRLSPLLAQDAGFGRALTTVLPSHSHKSCQLFHSYPSALLTCALIWSATLPRTWWCVAPTEPSCLHCIAFSWSAPNTLSCMPSCCMDGCLTHRGFIVSVAVWVYALVGCVYTILSQFMYTVDMILEVAAAPSVCMSSNACVQLHFFHLFRSS